MMKLQSPNAVGRTESVIRASEDHVALDISYYNDTLVFQRSTNIHETRDSVYLPDPSLYNISVSSFSITSDAVSRLSQPVETTTSTTTFWCGLSYGNTFYDKPVLIPLTVGDSSTASFRTIYSNYDFLHIINEAYQEATVSLLSGQGITGSWGAPMMLYSQSEGYKMAYPEWMYNPTLVGKAASPQINIRMSFDLYVKFLSFSASWDALPYANNHPFYFNLFRTGDNVYPASTYQPINPYGATGVSGATGSQNWMLSSQDGVWNSSIQDVNKILILTDTLPVQNEYISINTQANSNQQLSVLASFQAGKDTDMAALGENYLYTPSVLRFAPMTSKIPLRSYDISIYVQKIDGTVEPLQLRPGGYVSLKLIFTKKGLAN